MKTYVGYRLMEKGLDGQPQSCRCVVMVVGPKGAKHPLRPRLDIRNHSPAGFEWDYCGSGPAQLSLALVADACGRTFAVPAIYQRVKALLVARLPHEGWSITEEDVTQAVDAAMKDAGIVRET